MRKLDLILVLFTSVFRKKNVLVKIGKWRGVKPCSRHVHIGGRGQKVAYFCSRDKWTTPNLSDGLSLCVVIRFWALEFFFFVFCLFVFFTHVQYLFKKICVYDHPTPNKEDLSTYISSSDALISYKNHKATEVSTAEVCLTPLFYRNAWKVLQKHFLNNYFF